MSLINLFSNIWLFFVSDPATDNIILERLKQVHNINNDLCTDNLFKFWQSNTKGEVFAKEINAGLLVQNTDKLVAVWNTLTKRIATNIKLGTEPLLLYSSNNSYHECLIGFYLYFLKKTANITLDKSAKSLSSKIAGINYKMSPEMKKIIYQYCS